MTLNIGDERIVTIGPIAHGGHFIAHSDDRTLFVRHAITGETAKVRITEVAKRIVRADAIEIIETAGSRVQAPCRFSGECGGCDFQHIGLPRQRELKTQVLREALQRFGKMSDDDLANLDPRVQELPGHPDGLHWRTRMTWAANDGRVGLRKHHSHDIVEIDRCLIAAEGADTPDSGPKGKVTHRVGDREWRLAGDDFWQVHPALPETLVKTVLEFGAPMPGETWWDLYSGAGLFAAFLAEAAGEDGLVEAVESAEPGIKAARRALFDLPQVNLNLAEVARWLRTAPGRPDGVVLDPPRAGAGQKVLEAICERAPDRIVYVACDPVALGRDVAILSELGYELAAIQAFDAFPMTHHFETVAHFRATAQGTQAGH